MPFFEPIVICMMGIVVSIVWFRITTQGRDLQREWRKEVIMLEKQLFSESDGVEGPFTVADKELKEGHNSKVSITFGLDSLLFPSVSPGECLRASMLSTAVPSA